MLTSERDKRTCAKYGAYDETGHVHCCSCPLNVSEGRYDCMCKANSHYDRHKMEWVPDDPD